ncbi:MAG TPA: 50S ribosomal protein L25 [Candidatus Limnocylindrales bacterium]|jgi:large subunit ribosomal protein L25|nr:50S ribosomal protein L25 [Candidatus Limnocylindrales bacterium]
MSAAPARPKLAATSRDVTGKKVSYLRRDGKLPAVVYGRGLDSDNVTVDAHEFELLRRHAGPNTLIDLSVDGKKSTPILVHDVQLHRVTRQPLHADLYVVRMTDELTVDVALVAEGESEAIENAGGTLMRAIEHVRVRALPDHLPQSIHYSIESLKTFDDAIHVRDLEIPADATLLTDLEEVVAKVLPPRVEEEVTPTAEAEGEGAEGEGAEGEGGAGEGGESAGDSEPSEG